MSSLVDSSGADSCEPNVQLDESVPVQTGTMRWFEASSGLQFLDYGELWSHRALVAMLTARDLRIRYRQAAVGALWVLLQPLTSVAIFSVLFGLLGEKPTEDSTPYPIVVLCGLLPWQFVSSALTEATVSLVNNQNLITKVYFPRSALPVASITAALVDFAIASLVLAGLMAWYGISVTSTIFVLPVFVLLAMWTAFAIGITLSAANSLYRDIQFILPFFLQIGFFVSPVIYESTSLIPAEWQWLYNMNPAVGIIEGFRWSVLGHRPFPLVSSLTATGVLTVLTIGGSLYFRRVERVIADRI